MAPPGTKALLVSENSATTNLPCEHVASGNSTASRMTVPAADMPVSDTHPRGRPPRCFPSAPTPSVGHARAVAALAPGRGPAGSQPAHGSGRPQPAVQVLDTGPGCEVHRRVRCDLRF